LNDIKRFCFIGHVDHGKSSCAGHLYIKCGGLDERTLDKLKREFENRKNQLWASVLDVCDEEREKGKTHEFSTIAFEHENKKYELIDTPGHKMFIRSLIEGITSFENNTIIGCLLISAAKGEFESGWIKGQTKEDIIIAKSVGINNLIVLINKMDLVDWSEETYTELVGKIKPFITACKFKSVTYIPVSGYHGIGLIDKENMPNWWTGPSLLSAVDAVEIEKEIVEEIPLDKWNSMIAEIRILWTPNIIAPGFSCIMHYESEEYEITLERFKNFKFLKEKDVAETIIRSERPIVKKSDSKTYGRRFLLRWNNNTIGFGKIIKVK
jgi:translation elongation factor EF-1alpha